MRFGRPGWEDEDAIGSAALPPPKQREGAGLPQPVPFPCPVVQNVNTLRWPSSPGVLARKGSIFFDLGVDRKSLQAYVRIKNHSNSRDVQITDVTGELH